MQNTVISSCQSCHLFKANNRSMTSTVKTDTSVSPFQKIQIDHSKYSISGWRNRLSMAHISDAIIKWDGETRNIKHCYLIAAIDTLTKFTIATPMT